MKKLRAASRKRRLKIVTKYGSFYLNATAKGLYSLSLLKKANQGRQKLTSMKALRAMKIDYTGYTPFERRVLKALSRTKLGETLSYAELARRAGFPGASRAVGAVMKKNRLPLILPCHRVLAANGGLGGYSQGLHLKRKLLDLEKGS